MLDVLLDECVDGVVMLTLNCVELMNLFDIVLKEVLGVVLVDMAWDLFVCVVVFIGLGRGFCVG